MGVSAAVLGADALYETTGIVAVTLRVGVAVGAGSRYSLRTRGPSSSSTDMPSLASAMCLGDSSRALVAGPPSPEKEATPVTQLPAAVVSHPVPLTSRCTHSEPLSEMSRSPLPSSASPTGFDTF